MNREPMKQKRSYKPINDEELWGVPVKDQPEPDLERNFFDEAQKITTKGMKEPDTD